MLSLALGPALPITVIPMLLATAPAMVILVVGVVMTADDNHYRTFHRFSPTSKRLVLLFAVLALLGLIAFLAGMGHTLPERVGDEYVVVSNHGHDRTVVSESDYLVATAAITRLGADLALIMYSVSGLANLVRMHYRAPMTRESPSS
ncbi:hypothetical protein [Kutzneria sp. 744]|uniref:hypothetical protein n=1 Tax=Kutzneria sp. (strain 744) TaxID=345341 RepID=UPI001E53E80F|nr:hypothetical protein [Kutzneria sp. 744]